MCVNGTDLDRACAEESDENGDDVDGELELEELGDAVVDVPAPHHSLDDAREIVVRQYDVRRFLRHVRTSDALEQPRHVLSMNIKYHEAKAKL